MRSKLILIVVAVAVIITGIFLFSRNTNQANNQNTASQNNKADENAAQEQFSFSNPKKSAHYETNTPSHGAILAAPPVNVVIDFNFDLAPPSTISISNNGKEYATGDLLIDGNKLSMRRNFDQSAADGLYKVTYNACWPDRSCHDGYFEFAIDRSRASSYEDMTGKTEALVRMSNIMFKPKDIKISKGTKVTWINDEEVEHYVNTDSHPAHTYHPLQNSGALKLGDSYSVTFDTPGIYPYHCSAHAQTMTGNIIVE